MKILGLEHIAIAVQNLDTAAPFWKQVLKLHHQGQARVEDQGVTTDIYDTGRGKVELLEPLDENSPVARFLAKRGPGIHHLCLEVDDITSFIKELKAANVNVIYDPPRVGAEDCLVTFIHPRSTGGVLVELVQQR